MKTIKIEGVIAYNTRSYKKEFTFVGVTEEALGKYWEEHIYIAPYTIEIEAPDDVEKRIYDKTLKSLQEKRKLILAENERRINDIDQEIQEHLAIESE